MNFLGTFTRALFQRPGKGSSDANFTEPTTDFPRARTSARRNRGRFREVCIRRPTVRR